jgi:sulfhydrogenase subunit beta (sulfur reductase)
MKLKLDKKDFGPFLQSLIDDDELYAPVQLVEGVSIFKKIDRPEEVNITLLNTQKPLKDVFFPQCEVMFCYKRVGNQTQITSTEEVKKRRVVFGARPCDIEAISLIDQAYSGEEYADVYFLKKREATTIIGMACDRPLSTCFCTSTGGGPFVRKGSDLFFIDLGEVFLVELLTENGKQFDQNEYFKEAKPEDITLAGEIEKKTFKKMDSSPNSTLPLEGIEKKLEGMVENPIWERLHEKCIGCSVCTFLCPTCHCFDIVDEGSKDRGQRVRNWDSCLSVLYSLETSGHNPRPSGRERTRQRLMHKFNYFPKNFGRIACVGCGRCILYCPAHFDIRQAIEEIQKR